ncbi:MAG: isoleucine--tRNA ligase [Alphaproteobacteria bacterium]|nr:isoleucine--tRNA ligase [Alphaproteobacteria bacterium]
MSETPTRDYRSTLFLPKTDFPMKAGLPAAEPQWLDRWAKMDLYGQMRRRAQGRTVFVLHDGPIYANGDIHSGTGLNHILKDFVVRSQGMLGKDAPYVPGWDCHGLPIEWKVEEQYRAKGIAKDSVPTEQLRRDCRAFAEHWLGVQREQIKRLGCIGAWDRPYTTMDFRAEALIAGELQKFVEHGLLYRGFRPVMWSPVERTALAEAEIEYHEKTSPTIYVKFPLREAAHGGASVVIWTTTPWTIPANRAIAFSPTITYGLYEVSQIEEGGFASLGERLILADALAVQTAQHAKLVLQRLGDVDPHGLICTHPLRAGGYDFDVPLLPGEHVTAEAGTGFVHTAPGHGEEDYDVYVANKAAFAHAPDPFHVVAEDGSFSPQVPLFAGKRILTADGKDGDANGAVIRELIEARGLLAKGTLRHSYPHSWRSKAPVIFRATPQWFASLDKRLPQFGHRTLRELALSAIAQTTWYPPQGQNRIGAMVEGRPDWVLSRQRAWGVPLAIFVRKADGQILDDAQVNARILDTFRKEGADAWFTRPPSDFLGPTYAAEEFEQVRDILDVWFDSGSTHVFAVEQPIDPSWPRAAQADLYLEGSDQHRGWFQSSLLESCATRGQAPYKAVLTHGFVLDEKGHKMSKSLGNTLAPQVIADKNGADILRLWAASSDFTQDLRIGQDIIKANVEAYRRLRNTIRFMLANLDGFDANERLEREVMPELEQYMLARLAEIDIEVRVAYGAFDFNRAFSALFNFCTNDLSAFYFDVRKDALYCDDRSAVRRRAVRTVTDEIFRRVVTWLAPILVFTMEEAWAARFPGAEQSVHLQDFVAVPQDWNNPELLAKWHRIRQLRRVVTGALELARRDKVIGASLEAAPVLHVETDADLALFETADLAEIAITSQAQVTRAPASTRAFRLAEVPGVAVEFVLAEGKKCARCWMILPEVGRVAEAPELCGRCAQVVTSLEPPA